MFKVLCSNSLYDSDIFSWTLAKMEKTQYGTHKMRMELLVLPVDRIDLNDLSNGDNV